MKLISNLDVNGNKFINVTNANTLELVMPTVTGEGTITKTIATHDEIEAVISRFAGAFQFMGDALRIKAGTDPANSTIIVAEGQGEKEIVAASTNRGNVYQLADGREFASDGTVWVELGFNIQKASASADGLMSKEDYSKLSGIAAGAQVNVIESVEVNGTALTPDANKAVNIDLSAYDTITAAQAREALIAADLEEAEEVTAAALNDLNSRSNGLADRMTAAESAIESLDGDAVKSVAFGSNTALEPDANGKVTLTAATDSADGYMTATDHAKLSGIAAGAEVNVQADWSVTDTTSDAYIANKPTNLAVAYLHTIATAQQNNTVTIAKATHGCGNYPLVQVFAGNEVVSANVTVDTTNGGDVTVSWAGIDPTQTAIRIRIIGCPTEA